MLALLCLQSLCEAERLLYSPFIGRGDRIESICIDSVIVGAQFGQGKDSLVHFSLDDLVVGQLFPQDRHLRLQRAHFLLAVGLSPVVLSLHHV